MVDFYATLGVQRDATQEQIKAAFRRRSSEVHPDKPGGSTEAMQAVNKAYEVLGDAERRKLYDETGMEGTVADYEREVLALMRQLFECALEEAQVDLVGHCRKSIESSLRGQAEDIGRLEKAIATLTRRRSKVRVKKEGDVNLFHQLIDSKVDDHRRRLQVHLAGMKMLQSCSKLLDAYESSDEAPDMAFNTMPKAYLYFGRTL
jgi:curved DNA-binding protein CbpA